MNELSDPRLIIFTDLDGTLLDLESYSFQPALEALARVKETATPLLFCSSKTRVEQLYYQKEMSIRAPFIGENGSAIFIPEGYFSFNYAFERAVPGYRVLEMGISSIVIQRELSNAREKAGLQFRGYAQLSPEELCHLTGLDPEAATRAQQREYSETLVGLSRLEAETLDKVLSPAGLSCTWGSRFCTVAASQTDKGKAVTRLVRLFQKQYEAVRAAGIGDSANDASMLAAVDEAFLVQKPDQRWEHISVPGLKLIEGKGPTGWNRIVCDLLGDCGGNDDNNRTRHRHLQ